MPVMPVDLAQMPDDISRRLFEALRLEIRYDGRTNEAVCTITLSGETIDAVSRTAHEAAVVPIGSIEGDRMKHHAKEEEIDHDLSPATFCVVPPAGFEPAHTAPEAVALSPELRGRVGRRGGDG